MMVVEKVVRSKVCTHWVPRMQRNQVATDLLHQFDTGAKGFLSQIVMRDETWVHYFEPESSDYW